MRQRLAAVPRPVLVVLGVALAAVVVVLVAVVGGRDATAGPAPTGTGTTATAGPDRASASPTAAPTPSPQAGTDPPPAAEVTAVPEADLAVPYEPTVADPVPLDATATFEDGVTARLAALEPVQGEAHGPGEVAGAAVRVTVELTNGTAAPVGLGETVVNAYAGADAVPSDPLSGPGVQPFGGVLAPGATATGVYVFRVPEGLRDRLQVTVNHDPRVTTVLLEGAAPAA